MPKFAWEGRTKGGKVQKGVMEAATAEAVEAKLRSMEIMPTEGTVKAKGFDLMSGDFTIPGLGGGVSDKDLILFTRQFSTMIDAGLPLVQCLELLAVESENKAFKKVLLEVKETVESGSTFADALAKHPKVFDNLFVQMVKAGEIGGILDTIMTRLSLSMEKMVRLKKQIKGAMIYPSVILTVAITVTAVLLIFVVPIFTKMFTEMNIPGGLPKITQYVVIISDFLVKQWGWAYILIGVGAIIGIVMALNSNEKGQFLLHSFYFKIPVIGDLIKKSTVASFTRTLGTLISSGVPIMDGLEIVARVSNNKVVEKELMGVRTAIAEGKTLTEPLRTSKVFPHMVVQMIGVGEQTGAMDTMLAKIADFYEEEVDDAVTALTSLMEPMLMVFLGITVGGLAIAMYMPIFAIVGEGSPNE